MTTTSLPTNAVITANLVALHARLRHALAEVQEAQSSMALDQQNVAIGTIIDLERVLPECDALLRTILLLHRAHGRFEPNEVHS